MSSSDSNPWDSSSSSDSETTSASASAQSEPNNSNLTNQNNNNIVNSNIDKDTSNNNDTKSDKSSDTDSNENSNKDSDQDSDKNSDQSNNKDSDQDSDKNSDQDSDQDSDKDSNQDSDKDSNSNSTNDSQSSNSSDSDSAPQHEMTKSRPNIENVPSFPSLDDQNLKLAQTLPNRSGGRRNTTSPSAFSTTNLTPGSSFLKSQLSTSKLSSLEEKLRRKTDAADDGVISQLYTSNRSRALSMSTASVPHVMTPTEPDDKGIPPFTYEPGTEYCALDDEEQYIQGDQQISEFIQNHQDLQNYSWNGSMIKNIDEQDNPYLSPNADYLKAKDSESSDYKFQSAVPVQMLSEKVRQIEMQDVPCPDREEVPLSRSITFIYDTNKPESDDRQPPSVYSSYFNSQPPLAPRFKLNPVKTEQLQQNKIPYLGLTLKEFTMDPTPLEPFFFTAYLYSNKNKKFISEEWHFAPDSAVEIFKDSSQPIEINLNKQGVFELPIDYDDESKLKATFVVIAVSHPITIEGNAPVNKYYLKGSGLETNAKLNINKTFPNKNADVLTTFTYSFVSLADLLKELSTSENGSQFGQYTFKNFYALNSQFCCQKIKDHIQDSIKKKIKDGDYRIKISLDINFKRALHPSIDFQNFELVNLIEVPPPAITPNVRLCHKIAIHFDQAIFKLPKGVKGRNVYGEISLKIDESADGLKCLHSQLNAPNLTTIGKTRCFYHEPKGIFDEVFVFDLPYPIPPKLFIHCDLYHLVLKKSSDSKLWIGQVCIPIFESANTFIKNGFHSYNIQYKRGEIGNNSIIDPHNCLTFSTLITSILVPSDPHLLDFFSNISDTDSLKEANCNCMIDNFYAIVENLIEYSKTSPVSACKGLNVVYLALQDTLKEKLDEYFQIYAQVFAFRHPSSEYHRRLMEGVGAVSTLPPGLYKFIFMLIIKSIYLTKDRKFAKSYKEFLNGVPVSISHCPTKEAVTEYAKFINLLMDIGCYTASIEGATAMIYRLLKCQEVTIFIYELFHPKFLYLSIMNSDKIVDALIELFKYARCANDQVFQYLNYAIVVLPDEMKKEIARRLLNTLPVLSPLEKMVYARSCPNGRVHPVVAYFAYVLECMSDSEQIHEWFSSIENPSEFFDSLHFLLDITAVDNSSTLLQRETTYSVQAAILNSMTIMINVNEQMRELGFLTYHVLCSNIVTDFLPILMRIPTIIAQRDITFLFKYYCPPLPKILVNLFKVSKNEKNCLVGFLNTLFEKDREVYGDTRRSLALITRSLYQLNPKELKQTLDNLKQGIDIEIEEEEEAEEVEKENNYKFNEDDIHEYFNRGNLRFLYNLVRDYNDITNKINDPSYDFEEKSRFYWRLIEMFQYSPDVTIEILNKLSDLNLEEDYVDEAVQAKLLIAAIILEYLTLQNRIKPLFNEYHAAHAFESICSMISFAVYKDDDCPHLIGYCDSPKFNIKSLISLLLNLTKMSFNNKSQMQTYEQALGYIGILWPILESQKSFYYGQRFFKIENTVQMMLSKIPGDKDPLFGHYFRIAFFGDVFGKEDGLNYIYHEKMLTHLFELSTRLVDKYKNKYPGTPIELIKESGEVDRTKLNTKGAGYIQVTFVEPYFPKSEQLLRTSPYDQSHMIKTFKFDTPFTQSSSVQGTLEHQWLRRTILTVKNRMPSIFKVEKVIDIINKDLEPIKVSYRQLHDRSTQIQAAISQNDFRNIQQLLHGSLLVMVNEGPSKMAEVFLSGQGKLEGDPSKMEKYQQKLRKNFKLFLTVNEEALKLHANYVATNPMFIPLQNELEAGLQSLKDKLSRYIDDDDDFLNN